MKTTKDLYSANARPAAFTRAYFAHLGECLARIDVDSVAQLIDDLVAAREERRSIFIAGNGGSAATATHMVNDLAADVTRKAQLDVPFRVFALTDNAAVLTAIANDTSYDAIFVNQLKAWFQPGDRLLAISASGNSPNLVCAAKWVHEHGGRVLSLAGFDGGTLREMSDICVHIPTAAGEYGPAEDAHLVINHVISNWLICSYSSASAK